MVDSCPDEVAKFAVPIRVKSEKEGNKKLKFCDFLSTICALERHNERISLLNFILLFDVSSNEMSFMSVMLKNVSSNFASLRLLQDWQRKLHFV